MSRKQTTPPAAGPAVDPALGQAPDNDAPPIGPQDPSSMPRAEDDRAVFEGSLEFNDQPGSGKHRGGASVRDRRARRDG